MKRFIFLFSLLLGLAFTMNAQPIVYSGTYTATLAAAGTTYIYPLKANGDTVTMSSVGVNSSVITVDSTGGTGNGVATLEYCEVLANGTGNGQWMPIATATITAAATASTRTVTNPFASRRVRLKCEQTTTGATKYTLRNCYMNLPW